MGYRNYNAGLGGKKKIKPRFLTCRRDQILTVMYIWSNFGIEIYFVVTKRGTEEKKVETHML